MKLNENDYFNDSKKIVIAKIAEMKSNVGIKDVLSFIIHDPVYASYNLVKQTDLKASLHDTKFWELICAALKIEANKVEKDKTWEHFKKFWKDKASTLNKKNK
jgi:hypothetical protein